MAYRSRGRSKRRTGGTYRKSARTRRAAPRRGAGTQRVVIQVVAAPGGPNPAPFSVPAAAPRTRRF